MVESGIDAQIQFIDEKHANVVAKLQGKSSEIIIWNGHMDTVPYGDEQLWDTNPRTPIEKEGKIFARGASDMKSGLAGMIWTLCKMKEERLFFMGLAMKKKMEWVRDICLKMECKKMPN